MSTITIDVAQLVGAEGATLGEAIVDEAARMLIRDSAVQAALRERVQRIADEEIRGRLAPLLEEALEKSVTPTDPWGTPKGEETTLREYVVKRMKAYLTEPDPEWRNRGQRAQTRVETFIAKEIDKVVQHELRRALDAAMAQVAAGVKAKAADVIAETITRAAR